MPIKTSLFLLLLPITLLVFTPPSRAQDTLKTVAGSDTLKPRLLKAATVTRQTPFIQHRLDRIVLNVDHLITAAGTNTLELIRKLPGIQVSPDGLISLNGRSGVNVLVDGKPTYLSAEDLAALLAGMSSAEVQQLELMTNPPAKFDAQGTGGLINIIRKRNRADGFNGYVTTTIGEGNYPRYTGSILLSYKTKDYNLYVNNSYNYTKTLLGRDVTADIFNGDNLYTREVSSGQDVIINRANNTTAGIDWYLSRKTTLTLTGNIGVRRYDDMTTSKMNVFDADLHKTGSSIFTALNTDHPFNYTTGFQLSHRLDTTGREWSVNADYSEFRYRPGQFNTNTVDDPAGNFESLHHVFLDQSRTLRIVGARADYVHPWPGVGKWEAGIKSSYTRTTNNSSYYNQSGSQSLLDSSQSDYNVNTENINAAYINVNRQYKKLTLQSGLRMEQTTMKGQQLFADHSTIRQQYFQLFPSVFADYKLNTHNNLNIQLGRRIDRADYHELVPFRRPASPTMFFQGNPNLRPALSWHGEITWSWRTALFITIGYDIDKDYVRTIPYLDANDSTITRRPTNIQGAHSWNLDLSYNHPVTKWWTTNTTASFYQNSFSGNAKGFNLGNPGIVSLDLNCNNSISIGDNFTGEIDFETETRRQFVQSTFGAYSILSFGLRKQLPGKKATLSLNAHNVLQSEGRSGTDRYLDLIQSGYGHPYTRAVTLTLNYRFGSGKLAQTKTRSGSDKEQQRAGN
ncbi:MAG TPA: outer membrane beta-barrel family protein [Puia sp.]|jgi:hypothetical protein|nr:outer membrane beta-barrel family protein [Puia sp.]